MMTPNNARRSPYSARATSAGVLLMACSIAVSTLSGCKSDVPSTQVLPASNAMSNVQDVPLLTLLKKIEKQSLDSKVNQLVEYRTSTNSESGRRKAAYVLARLHKKSGTMEDIKAALPLFEEAVAEPALTVRACTHAAECATFLGEEKIARHWLEEVLASSKDPKERATAEYALAQNFLRSQDKETAKVHFEQTVKELPDSQVAIGSKFYLGQMKFEAGDRTGALALWRDYLRAFPDGRYAPQIVASMKAFPDTTADDQLWIAEVHYFHAQPDKALLAWSKAGDKSQWVKQAQCLFRLGKPNLARETLVSGIRNHPKDPAVVDAAKILCKPVGKEDAIKIWQLVLAHSPANADAALYNIAMRAPEKLAVQYYSEIARKYPLSDYAPESSWWLLWSKIADAKYEAALADAKTFSEKYAKARAGARFHFWTGKLYERLKKNDEAKLAYQKTIELYPKDYYGWRAKGRLSALSGGRDRGWSTNLAEHIKIYSRDRLNWDWPEPPHLVTYEELEKAYGAPISMLTQLRQWDELLELTSKDEAPEIRSLSLAKSGRPLEAINTMSRELSGRPGDSPAWQLSYPLLYGKIMAGEGALKKVDPLLAQALTREESRYNVDAVSLSNARGLMQLLPPTAYGVAKKLGVTLSGMRDMHRPEINLKLGIDYLSYTLGRFKGNAMLAVASYNGGPNAVARFTKQYSMADPDSFVEQIPYTETRDYVRKVFGSYWNYEGTYTSPTIAGDGERNHQTKQLAAWR